METSKLRKLGTSIIGLIFILAGCTSEDLTNSSLSVGKIRIHGHGQKSSSLSIVSAKVMIRQVQIRGVSGNFITFLDENFELDLLQLASNAAPILAKARIPSGYYDHIRLITDSPGIVELSDGRKLDLNFPSGEQTGIKIFLDEPIRVDHSTISRVKLEFNLDDSFVARGSDNSSQGISAFNFKPVLQVNVDEIMDENPNGSTETVTEDGEHVTPGTTPSPSPSASPTPSPSPSSEPSPSPSPSASPVPNPNTGSDGTTTIVDYPVIGI